MTPIRKREFLQSQLVETDHLSELSQDDDVMRAAWQIRREDIENELRASQETPAIPSAILLFSGGTTVVGSEGIDAEFSAHVLGPYQEMVNSQFAERRHGKVGQRGPTKDESHARLFITSLPRGSFGFELSHLAPTDLLSAQELSDALNQVTKVIDAASKSDSDFAAQMETTSPRVINKLVSFFEVLVKSKVNLVIESGSFRAKLTAPEIASAKNRVEGTTTDENDSEVEGVFKGAVLNHWRFDFDPDREPPISGVLNDAVTEEDAVKWNSLTGKRCRAKLKKIDIRTPAGNVRTRYELIELHEESGR